jgi:hypothetical protein
MASDSPAATINVSTEMVTSIYRAGEGDVIVGVNEWACSTNVLEELTMPNFTLYCVGSCVVFIQKLAVHPPDGNDCWAGNGALFQT